MRRISSGRLITGGLIAGFVTVASLVLPWFDILGRQRSSVDILRSASVLDVIEGPVKVAVILGWLLAPILVAGSMLLGASGRHKIAAVLLLPVGIVTILIVGAGLVVDQVDLAWGAFVGLLAASVASILAILVLIPQARTHASSS